MYLIYLGKVLYLLISIKKKTCDDYFKITIILLILYEYFKF
jgi:hypothetical protein